MNKKVTAYAALCLTLLFGVPARGDSSAAAQKRKVVDANVPVIEGNLRLEHDRLISDLADAREGVQIVHFEWRAALLKAENAHDAVGKAGWQVLATRFRSYQQDCLDKIIEKTRQLRAVYMVRESFCKGLQSPKALGPSVLDKMLAKAGVSRRKGEPVGKKQMDSLRKAFPFVGLKSVPQAWTWADIWQLLPTPIRPLRREDIDARTNAQKLAAKHIAALRRRKPEPLVKCHLIFWGKISSALRSGRPVEEIGRQLLCILFPGYAALSARYGSREHVAGFCKDVYNGMDPGVVGPPNGVATWQSVLKLLTAPSKRRGTEKESDEKTSCVKSPPNQSS